MEFSRPNRTHGQRIQVVVLSTGCLLTLTVALTAGAASPPSDGQASSSRDFSGSELLPSDWLLHLTAPVSKLEVGQGFGQLPLRFEANRGQVDGRVKFLSRGRGYTLFLTADEAVLALERPEVRSQKRGATARIPSPEPRIPSVVRLKLVGADPSAEVAGLEEQPGKSNYFIGNDPAKWRSKVPNYAKVRYKDVWPGIDLVYYGNQRQLEYDFVVQPGAGPKAIALRIETENSKIETRQSPISLDARGDLVIATETGEIRFRKPLVYQPTGSLDAAGSSEFRIQNSELVEGRYVLRLVTPRGTPNSSLENGDSGTVASSTRHSEFTTQNSTFEVSFELAAYDPTRPLIIDPVLSYSTYLGGSKEDIAYALAVDGQGSVYVTGSAGSTDFPTASEYQGVNRGLADVFIAKLNPEGTALVYSTYLGGTGFDRGNGIGLDASGNAYITGSTSSSNFPVTSGVLQATFGGGTCGTAACADAFVAKLGPAGASLVYSTYLGGGGADAGQGIAVDSSGAAYIVGSTDSADFHTVGPFQSTFGGWTDVFVAKVNASGSALTYSTYLGGNDADFGQGITVDADGNAYVTGFTFSTNFPTASPLQASPGGSADAFIAKFNASGSALLYSTYLGGSGLDRAFAIALDGSGSAYVTGDTTSTDFPTTAGAFQTAYGGNGDAFVAKLASSGSALTYATLLGGIDTEQGLGVAVDVNGRATVTGFTRSDDFPVEVAPLASFGGGLCGSSPCSDAFVTRLNESGSALVFSTYLGGGLADVGQAVAVDSSGYAFAVGSTASADLPPTMGVPQFARGGTGPIDDAFIVRISPEDVPGLAVAPQKLVFADQPTGTTSAAKTITLTSVGSQPLTISEVTVTGDFAETNDCVSGLGAGGARCTVSVTFTPAEIGERTGSLTVTSDAADSPHLIDLSGQGVEPEPAVTLEPTSLTFSDQTFETTSDPQTITLANSGTADLTITKIEVSGDFAETHDCGDTLQPGGSCTISVTFTPKTTAEHTGQVSITSDATGSPHKVGLSGTGIAIFSLSSPEPTVLVTRGTDSATFTIAASAPESFTSAINLACADNAEATCSFSPTSITPGQSSTLTLGNLSVLTTDAFKFRVDGTSGSQTAAVQLELDFRDFGVSASPDFTTVSAGESATFELTVTPKNGFTGTVTFSCDLLPRESTCTFSPTSVELEGSDPQTAEVKIQTTQRSRMPPTPVPRRFPPVLLVGAAILAVLVLVAGITRRAPRFVTPMVAGLVLALLLTSCSGIEYRTVRGTLSGTYTIVITAKSGEIVHAASVLLTVN